MGEKYLVSGVEMIQGIIHRFKKEWDASEESFNRGLKMLEEINVPFDTAINLFEYGKMFIDKGDKARAKDEFDKALEIFQALGSKTFIGRVEEAIKEL